MMNLYMISLGGKVEGCSLEVHDIKFIAANHIDETIELLKSHWYGLPFKLHMDSYKEITGVEGYALRLTKEKPTNNKELYFIHMGGYRTDSFQELHDVFLLVDESEQAAKERASKDIRIADIENHVDNIVSVNSSILSVDGETYYIELNESKEAYHQKPDWFGYRRIDIKNV